MMRAVACLLLALLTMAAPARADDPRQAAVRGTVVDEKGVPVAGASVDLVGRQVRPDSAAGRIVRFGPVTTGSDGNFVLPRDQLLLTPAVRASADGGERLAVTPVLGQASATPLRMVLRPRRAVTIRVADTAGKPVAGAAVEVGTPRILAGVVDPGLTDDDGVARFRIPADTLVRSVVAMKDAVGFDFSTKPVFESAEVALTLRSSRTITFRARDSAGRPVAGVTFHADEISPTPGDSSLSVGSISEVTTGADGFARWRWFPEATSARVDIGPPGDLVEDAAPWISAIAEGDLTVPIMFRRLARLSGRVVNADGSPAPGVSVMATGLAKFGDDGRRGDARTGPDGSYTMTVRPDSAYLVAVTSPGHASVPIQDVPIGEGASHGGLNFVLTGGTRLHGQVETEAGRTPSVYVYLLGEEIPAHLLNRSQRRLRLPIRAPIDAQGQYEIRLGPGDYEIASPGHRIRPTVHLTGEGEFPLNFVGDFIPPVIRLTGTLVEPVPGGGERPAKGRVFVSDADGVSFSADAGDSGLFSIMRYRWDVGLYATSGTGAVAAVKVAAGTNDVKVVLGPSASASGRVVDASGKPFSGEGPRMSVRGGPGLPPLTNPVSLSKFDAAGRYEFKGLIPGVEYRIVFAFFRDTGAWNVVPIKTLRVEGPGPIDLGEFVVPDDPPKPE